MRGDGGVTAGRHRPAPALPAAALCSRLSGSLLCRRQLLLAGGLDVGLLSVCCRGARVPLSVLLWLGSFILVMPLLCAPFVPPACSRYT